MFGINKTALFTIIAIVLFIFIVNSLRRERKLSLPYELRTFFLKEYEINFINVVSSLGLFPAPKVRVSNFVRSTINKKQYYSPITTRSVDFLILNPSEKFAPVACLVFSTNRNKTFFKKLADEIDIPYVEIVPHSSREEIIEAIKNAVDVDSLGLENNNLLSAPVKEGTAK